MHAWKSLLLSNPDIWIKNGNKDFDITMGSFNGVEICELVGLYSHISYKLGEKHRQEIIGLYGHDGLACSENISGSHADLIRKDFVDILKGKFYLNIFCHNNPKSLQ